MPTTLKNTVLGGHSDAAPLIWTDGITMRGVGPEIAMEILTELGVTVLHAPKLPYKRTMRFLQSGNIDLVAGMVANEERGGFSEFVQPQLMSISPYIFTMKNKKNTVTSWNDLVNLRGAAHRGSAFGKKFDEFANSHLSIDLVTLPIDTLKILARGRVDYALHHRLFGMLQMKVLGIENQIAISDKPLGDFSQAINFAFSKQSPCKYLSSAFGEKLSKYLAEHDLEVLLNTHTQAYLHYLKSKKGSSNDS
ncbi:MAG: hypothetical protein V7707_18590 [Motiliproteus sp.]